MDNPFRTFDEIRNAYLRYLDSPFRLRYGALLEERSALLNADRQLFREPLIEPLSPYEQSDFTIVQACAHLGVPPAVAGLLTSGLFRSELPLYQHQLEAWEQSRAGRSVVVTSGTGSGKTECYLIPVLSYLAEEALQGWGSLQPPNNRRCWWQFRRQGRISQRGNEPQERPAAIRALFLYPLNALIEDQLGRIRRAIDVPLARQWFSQNCSDHRIWFGRYNSLTPVSGPEASIQKRAQLKARMKEMDAAWQSAQRAAVQRGNPRILDYFQNPDGSEMWSRWDMHDSPPDILITNYSMLNIMLMRSIEDNFFESTRRWLADDRNRKFHLVVDELHTYRGTKGTEVGYLLRAFLHRIGLTPDSNQLRIIATSASIENDPESRTYLQEFFGRDQTSFDIIPGQRRSFEPPPEGLGNFQSAFERLDADLDSSSFANAVTTFASAVGADANGDPERVLADALLSIHAVEPVRVAGAARPFTLDEFSQSVFNGCGPGRTPAARGLLRGLVRARIPAAIPGDTTAPLPLRVHYFFHNAGRLWACVNPNCSGRTGTTPPGEPTPPIGKLFVEPKPRCDGCGSRVLELLYCQPCGEVFVGGYKQEVDGLANSWFLSPDYPHLERVPDRSASLRRTFEEFAVFWPARGGALFQSNAAGPRWTWQEDNTPGYQWRPATLVHGDGCLQLGAMPGPGTTLGYTFISPVDDSNGFASRCPHCGSDWHTYRINSPIRDLGSGFQRIMQLLTDALMRQLEPSVRKFVLFSDSRQDAAKLSTGIKRDHYFDVVRQLAFGHLHQQIIGSAAQYARDLELHAAAFDLFNLQRQLLGGLNPEEGARYQQRLQSLPQSIVGSVVSAAMSGGAPPAPPSAPTGFVSLQLISLVNQVRTGLLALGMNPGGPLPSVSEYRSQGQTNARAEWVDLIHWDRSPPEYRNQTELQQHEIDLRDRIEAALLETVIESVLFAAGSRDFESLRLGFLWRHATGPGSVVEQAAASVVRMIAKRRWDNGINQGQGQPPGHVQRYIEAVATANGLQPNRLELDIVASLGSTLSQWLIDPRMLRVVAPTPNAHGNIEVFNCTRCGRAHLHRSGGICTGCREALPATPMLHSTTNPPEDYYEFLARQSHAPFRLACEELTGQSDRDDRTRRQRRFQEVFIEEEVDAACGVDLLSVTTTMEAGVDIGALQSIGLANMPPVRFNYQQRVGRAGRRGLGLSAALTLCRGRSHDDYYFERPEMITADPPPRPYVDVSRRQIAERVINKEVLRSAFRTLPIDFSRDNVHGEFGSVGQWAGHRPTVEAWIAANRDQIRAITAAILRRTDMDSNGDIDEITDHVSDNLTTRIDDVANDPISAVHFALSERLAFNGILPMFGFPTRVRYLYHDWPRGWPPDQIVDRELDIAISQFAPMAQTIKDDRLLTAVGVVDFRPGAAGRLRLEPNPLGVVQPIGICRQCQGLVEQPQPAGVCPLCQTPRSADGYRVVDVTEPPGFSTWFLIKSEFQGGMEFTPRALRARMGAGLENFTPRRNFSIDSDAARIFRINDNDGNDFTFQKQLGQDFWFVDEAIDSAMRDIPRRERRPPPPDVDPAAPSLTRALAAISTTDVLAVGIESPPIGLCLNPTVPEARAAWYSFGFLVRRAAAVSLDINESELDLGLQPYIDPSSPFAPPSARIFMSDSLENGAGYSTFLGDAERFEELLRFILGEATPSWTPHTPPDSFYRPLALEDHGHQCSMSCHRCLREFGNMAFHSLLDWRLGLDMVKLALDPAAQIDLQAGYWADLVAREAGPYFDGLARERRVYGGLEAGVDPANNSAVILIHPLWDRQAANHRAEVQAAMAEAEHDGLRPTLMSVFHAVRFPYE